MLFVALLYFVSFFLEALCQGHAISSIENDCTEISIPAEQLEAYRNWPFRIPCNAVFSSEDYNIYYWYDVDENPVVQCIILNGESTIIFNDTVDFDTLIYGEVEVGYLTPDLTDDSPLEYTLLTISYNGPPQNPSQSWRTRKKKVVISKPPKERAFRYHTGGHADGYSLPPLTGAGWATSLFSPNWSTGEVTINWDGPGSRCIYAKMRLILSDVEDTFCNGWMPELPTQRLDKYPRFEKVGQPREFNCKVGLHDYPKISAVDSVTYQWYHNCNTTLPGNIDFDPNDPSRISIAAISFENAGSYSCSVTYKGRTRFLPLGDMCLTNGLSINEIIVECDSNEISANIGERVTTSCQATFGEGSIQEQEIKIFVLKQNFENSSLFENVINDCGKINSETKNIGCTLSNPSDYCYPFTPTKEKQKPLPATIQLNITFSSITEEDYGTYLVYAQHRLVRFGAVNVSFVVQPNLIPYLLSQAAIAGICIGALLFLLIISFVVMWNLVYVKVYYKVIFADYELDNKEYGAMLVYNFSNTELDKYARETVQTAIPSIRKFLEENGYHVYDEYKDGTILEGRADNLASAVERSHRVIVFLSSDLIRNDWSLLTLHKGFEEMINSRSKLIFILLPGIKEHLKQHAKEDETFALIQRAVKLNYSIGLPKNMKNRRFQFEMRNAMPKLRGRPRLVSSVSSSLSGPDYQNVNFQRCFSNETQITEIDVPTGMNGEILKIIETQDDGVYDNAL